MIAKCTSITLLHTCQHYQISMLCSIYLPARLSLSPSPLSLSLLAYLS